MSDRCEQMRFSSISTSSNEKMNCVVSLVLAILFFFFFWYIAHLFTKSKISLCNLFNNLIFSPSASSEINGVNGVTCVPQNGYPLLLTVSSDIVAFEIFLSLTSSFSCSAWGFIHSRLPFVLRWRFYITMLPGCSIFRTVFEHSRKKVFWLRFDDLWLII